MWRSSLVVYFCLLTLLVLLAAVGGQLQDQARELFDIFALGGVILLAVVLAVYARSRARKTKNLQRTSTDRRAGVDDSSASCHVSSAHGAILVVVGTVLGLCVTWACLIYLGTLSIDAQGVALANMRITTSALTAAGALGLAFFVQTTERLKAWMLRAAAIAMLFLQGVGLIVVPAVALRLWNDYVDFSKFAQTLNLNWFYVTLAAVVICFVRTRRQAPP